MAESKRILIIFKDGTMVLWGIQENKVISTTGGETHSVGHESKNVTAACWACPFGSKAAVGYSNGDIIIFSIFPSFKLTTDLASRDRSLTESSPPCKLNLAFKVQIIPIALMKCAMDGTTTRLYILGASDAASNNFLQVVLLNEHTESPRIKLGLQLPEQCIGMDLRPSSPEKSKHQKGFLLLLGKSGHVYAYDDHLIAKYLVQYNSRSPSSIPQEVKIKLPFPDTKITCAESITNNSCWLRSKIKLPFQDGFSRRHCFFQPRSERKEKCYLRGNHTRHGEDVALSYEDLSVIFSNSNYPADVDNTNDLPSADAELDIDDIELEDSEDKPKGHKHNIMGALKNQKLPSRFLSFRGKSKQTKSETEKIPQPMEPPKIDNDPTVDEIKRKYGCSAPSESNIAEMAKNKLNENLRKLQGINLRSSEMQETAQSFSSMAKDLLHTFERNKQNS